MRPQYEEGEHPMYTRLKLATAELLTNSQTRTVLILSTLVIAALVGGAPDDWGGGGGR